MSGWKSSRGIKHMEDRKMETVFYGKKRGKLYGFYSERHARAYGTVIYSTPDGFQIEVTAVYRSRTPSSYKWPDAGCVGEVVDFVRKGREGHCVFT